MNINPTQSRTFLIATPDALVGMDLVGIVSSACPQSATRVAQHLADIMPHIETSGMGTVVLVSSSLLTKQSGRILETYATTGTKIVVLENSTQGGRKLTSATFLEVPFTTATVLDAIGIKRLA